MIRTEWELKDKMRRIQHLASKSGCSLRSQKRIEEKLRAMWVDMGTIVFDDVEVLAMFLDEKLTYDLYYTMLRMAWEGKISILKKGDYYYLDVIPF